MIPHNLVYHRPETLAEAGAAYTAAAAEGLKPYYLAGGTEITTFARRGLIDPGALIDLKSVPECRELVRGEGKLVFGAALTLNEIIEEGSFPMLSAAARIVDHTVRNRLTLGGNIAGMLPYRETVLPFLLTAAEARLAGPEGERGVPLEEIFSRRLKPAPGEFLVQLRVPEAEASLPWFRRRRVKQSRLDYPVLTLCALRAEEGIRLAVSGAFEAPVRSRAAEEIINDGGAPAADRAARAAGAFGLRIRDDQRASAEYREWLLRGALEEAIRELGGEG